MRQLPDPDLSLRDASDFILGSPLGRRALSAPEPANLAVFIRDLIETIYKLTVSCHMAEFTDHGLNHLCSLVDRLSRWTTPGENSRVVVEGDNFQPRDAAILLVATLLHDIGMLSQRTEDDPSSLGRPSARALRDMPGWVRESHIRRIDRLIRFLFEGSDVALVLSAPVVVRACSVASAHGTWPWDWNQYNFQEKDAGLAAMLAVSDLLDEDSMRCDSATLLRHRFGTSLNRAHWIRHGLTAERILVKAGRVRVRFARPPRTDARMEPIFDALRNHYRLVLLYLNDLAQVDASLLGIDFDPLGGVPTNESSDLTDWWQLSGFETNSALNHHLFKSFMPEALLDPRRLPQNTIDRLHDVGLTTVNLTRFNQVRGEMIRHTDEEESFQALLEF